MKELDIQVSPGAPVEVDAISPTNSEVVVTLHVMSTAAAATPIDQLTSYLSVGFDNSTDRSAASTGVRLAPLRDPKYAPPRAATMTAVISVLPTEVTPGSIRVKTATAPALFTIPSAEFSDLNQDMTDGVPARRSLAAFQASPEGAAFELPGSASNLTAQEIAHLADMHRRLEICRLGLDAVTRLLAYNTQARIYEAANGIGPHVAFLLAIYDQQIVMANQQIGRFEGMIWDLTLQILEIGLQ